MERILSCEKFEQSQVIVEKSVFKTTILPRERVLSFSPSDFEIFICEWASFRKIYNDIHRIGQAGDKGRDVISYLANGDMHYYQCKRYKDKLSPSEYWIEFGKLVYYIYLEEIKFPKKYYIVAANNLSSDLLDLIHEPNMINDELINNWDTYCKNKIRSKVKIDLTNDLKKFIQNFDFSIIDSIDIDSIIRDYSETPLFYFRFGGNKIPTRSEKLKLPEKVDLIKEKIYLTQLLDIYSAWKSISFNLTNINSNLEVYEDFIENRTYYYDAESLRRDLRDVYLGNDEFNLIKEEIYSGLINFMKTRFSDPYDKLNSVLHESTKVDLTACTSHSILNFVYNNDKKGICHHLVNDGKMRWK